MLYKRGGYVVRKNVAKLFTNVNIFHFRVMKRKREARSDPARPRPPSPVSREAAAAAPGRGRSPFFPHEFVASAAEMRGKGGGAGGGGFVGGSACELGDD